MLEIGHQGGDPTSEILRDEEHYLEKWEQESDGHDRAHEKSAQRLPSSGGVEDSVIQRIERVRQDNGPEDGRGKRAEK
jgi:hypothetical protein